MFEVFIRANDVDSCKVPTSDGSGDSGRAIAAVWTEWMRWAIPRIRSAVLATRPLRPFAHQDDAVFGAMLSQPRLRFLLADEPGTGKTLMTGMYLAEGRRRGLVPGKTVIVVPAHLVEKWIRELKRFFGIDAHRITAEIGRDPLDLRDDVDVWVVSLDLYTYNSDVRRKIVGSRASWSLAVFDEAHRLTPTSQYLGAARLLADTAHHLLLLTATPHRGKEHFFRALLHLLDPAIYPWDESAKDYGGTVLRPGRDNFLRRMKEDLRNLDGSLLFRPRFAETREVHLTPAEADAYQAVMGYVDTWYASDSVLAHSIYGKRAASSITAAVETLRRRAAALAGSQAGRTDPVAPHGFDQGDLGGADLDSDEAWQEAEHAVLQTRSRDRRAELEAVKAVIGLLEHALTSKDEPAKWQATVNIMAGHNIAAGSGQLLIFTEFTDTARWLAGLFRGAGFSTEVLDGSVDQHVREDMQMRFLANRFQVLVSTDAGGEGIDLQSAHVMIDWDIPWSLVRLEQRAGRLHRIGQTDDVHIYHLVAPETREGRVQQVMLDNLTAASLALNGRIYDLLDATVDRAGFSFGAAMAAAHRDPDAVAHVLAAVPDTETLVARAKEIVADEDQLRTPVNPSEAMQRLAADRLQAINPVIVSAFVDQVAQVEGWTATTGPTPGIRILRSSHTALPDVFGGGSECLIAADAAAVIKAREEQFRRAGDVVVLGPTEEAFQELVNRAGRSCEGDLLAGAAAVDLASLTGYALFLYAADFEHHDGFRRSRRTVPFLVRYSGAGAFTVAWESVMNLTTTTAAPTAPAPAARFEADTAARAAVDSETARLEREQQAITAKTRADVDDIERRYKRQVRNLASDAKREALDRFAAIKAQRLGQLDLIDDVSHTAPRRLGWIHVAGGARAEDLGRDPDSEKVAIAKVVAELEGLGWVVDDRQTAGLGYDLFARRPGTTDQRLIEVKGFIGDLRPVILEQHEWAQAQQRGRDYWLYVVLDCASQSRVAIRCQDPAGTLAGGPKLIKRFKIPVSQLRRLMEGM
ncbi:helicase-related protein [Actinoplanes sp. ATCC 53533]|uniref:helicase-related protein n=2 Tax=Actinoplanes sp. ATCC 53533 TaxID=1288362 RepID=UPI000F76D72A|nr:helicase-related protein [Actinoplanes sp. ATCC 53533]